MSKETTFNKTKIVNKITILFHTRGYSDTSMQDIVAVTGLNRSSIYNTFGSKLELFTECFENCETRYKRDIQKIILSSENAIKTIRQILELSINESNNGYLIPNYFSEIKNKEPLIRKMIMNQQEYLFDLFEDIIRRGKDLGTINNSKSTKQFANYLLTSYQGLQSMKILALENNKLENVIYDVISVLE